MYQSLRNARGEKPPSSKAQPEAKGSSKSEKEKQTNQAQQAAAASSKGKESNHSDQTGIAKSVTALSEMADSLRADLAYIGKAFGANVSSSSAVALTNFCKNKPEGTYNGRGPSDPHASWDDSTTAIGGADVVTKMPYDSTGKREHATDAGLHEEEEEDKEWDLDDTNDDSEGRMNVAKRERLLANPALHAYVSGKPPVHQLLPYAIFRKFDASQPSLPIRRRARPKVLIADSNLIHLIASKVVFDKYFEVVDVCTDGRQVLQLLQVNVYDIIFLSLDMGELDGPETVETIRIVEEAADAVFRVLVVGMLTKAQAADPLTCDRCFVSGMDRYILKPLAHHVHLVQSTISSVSVSEGFRRAILEKQWFSNRGYLLALLKGTPGESERAARIADLIDEPELYSEAVVTTLIESSEERKQVENLLARQRHEELQRMNSTILQMNDIISDLNHEVSVLRAENAALKAAQGEEQLLALQRRTEELENEVVEAKREAAEARERAQRRETDIRQLLESGARNEKHVAAAVAHSKKHRLRLELQENANMAMLDALSGQSWHNYYGSIHNRDAEPLRMSVPKFATDVTASWFRTQLAKLMAIVQNSGASVLGHAYTARNDLVRRANAILHQQAQRSRLSTMTSMFVAPRTSTADFSSVGGGGESAKSEENLLSGIVVSSMAILTREEDEVVQSMVREVESCVADLLVREHFLFEAIEHDNPKTIRAEIGMIRSFIHEQRKRRLANSVASQTEPFEWSADVLTESEMAARIASGADVFDYHTPYCVGSSSGGVGGGGAKEMNNTKASAAQQRTSSTVRRGLLVDNIPATGKIFNTYLTKGHLRKKWAKVKRAVAGKKLLTARTLPAGVVDEDEEELLNDLKRAVEESNRAAAEKTARGRGGGGGSISLAKGAGNGRDKRGKGLSLSKTLEGENIAVEDEEEKDYYGLNDPNDPLLLETASFSEAAFLPGAGGVSRDGKVKSRLILSGVLIDDEDLSSDTCSESIGSDIHRIDIGSFDLGGGFYVDGGSWDNSRDETAGEKAGDISNRSQQKSSKKKRAPNRGQQKNSVVSVSAGEGAGEGPSPNANGKVDNNVQDIDVEKSKSNTLELEAKQDGGVDEDEDEDDGENEEAEEDEEDYENEEEEVHDIHEGTSHESAATTMTTRAASIVPRDTGNKSAPPTALSASEPSQKTTLRQPQKSLSVTAPSRESNVSMLFEGKANPIGLIRSGTIVVNTQADDESNLWQAQREERRKQRRYQREAKARRHRQRLAMLHRSSTLQLITTCLLPIAQTDKYVHRSERMRRFFKCFDAIAVVEREKRAEVAEAVVSLFTQTYEMASFIDHFSLEDLLLSSNNGGTNNNNTSNNNMLQLFGAPGSKPLQTPLPQPLAFELESNIIEAYNKKIISEKLQEMYTAQQLTLQRKQQQKQQSNSSNNKTTAGSGANTTEPSTAWNTTSSLLVPLAATSSRSSNVTGGLDGLLPFPPSSEAALNITKPQENSQGEPKHRGLTNSSFPSAQSLLSSGALQSPPPPPTAKQLKALQQQLNDAIEDGAVSLTTVSSLKELEDRITEKYPALPSLPTAALARKLETLQQQQLLRLLGGGATNADVIDPANDPSTSPPSLTTTDDTAISRPWRIEKKKKQKGKGTNGAESQLLNKKKLMVAAEALLGDGVAAASLRNITSFLLPTVQKCVEKANLLSAGLTQTVLTATANAASAATAAGGGGDGGGGFFLTEAAISSQNPSVSNDGGGRGYSTTNRAASNNIKRAAQAGGTKVSGGKSVGSRNGPPDHGEAFTSAVEVAAHKRQAAVKERLLFERRLNALLDETAATTTGGGGKKDGSVLFGLDLLSTFFAGGDRLASSSSSSKGNEGEERDEEQHKQQGLTNAELIAKFADVIDENIADVADSLPEYAAAKALSALLRTSIAKRQKKAEDGAYPLSPYVGDGASSPSSTVTISLEAAKNAAATLSTAERPTIALSVREVGLVKARLAAKQTLENEAEEKEVGVLAKEKQLLPEVLVPSSETFPLPLTPPLTAKTRIAAAGAGDWVSLATVAGIFQVGIKDVQVHFNKSEDEKLQKDATTTTPTTTSDAMHVSFNANTVMTTNNNNEGPLIAAGDNNNTDDDVVVHIPVSHTMLESIMKRRSAVEEEQRKKRSKRGSTFNLSSGGGGVDPLAASSHSAKAAASSLSGLSLPGEEVGGAGEACPPSTMPSNTTASTTGTAAAAVGLGTGEEGIVVTDVLLTHLTRILAKIATHKIRQQQQDLHSLPSFPSVGRDGDNNDDDADDDEDENDPHVLLRRRENNAEGEDLPIISTDSSPATAGLPHKKFPSHLSLMLGNTNTLTSNTTNDAALTPHHHRLLQAVLSTQQDIIATYEKEDAIQEKQHTLEALKAAPPNTILDLDGVYSKVHGGGVTGGTTQIARVRAGVGGGGGAKKGAAASGGGLGKHGSGGGVGTGVEEEEGFLLDPSVPPSMAKLYYKRLLVDGSCELLEILVPALTTNEASSGNDGIISTSLKQNQQLASNNKKIQPPRSKGGLISSSTPQNASLFGGGSSRQQQKALVARRRLVRECGTCTSDDSPFATGGVPIGNVAGYAAFDLVTRAQRHRRRVLMHQRFKSDAPKAFSVWHAKRTNLLRDFIGLCKSRQQQLLSAEGTNNSIEFPISGHQHQHKDVHTLGEGFTHKDLHAALSLAFAQQQAEEELRRLTVPYPKDTIKAFLTAPTVHSYQAGETAEELLGVFGAVGTAHDAIAGELGGAAAAGGGNPLLLSPTSNNLLVPASGASSARSGPLSPSSAAISPMHAPLDHSSSGNSNNKVFNMTLFKKSPLEMLHALFALPPVGGGGGGGAGGMGIGSGGTALLPANLNSSSLHTGQIDYGNPLEVQKLPIGAYIKQSLMTGLPSSRTPNTTADSRKTAAVSDLAEAIARSVVVCDPSGLYNDEGLSFMTTLAERRALREASKKAKQDAENAAAIAQATAIVAKEEEEIAKAKRAAAAALGIDAAGLAGLSIVNNSQQTIIVPYSSSPSAAAVPSQTLRPLFVGQELTLSIELIPLLRVINACSVNPRAAITAITGSRYPSQHVPYPTSAEVDELLLAAGKLWKWLCALGQLALEPPTMPLTPFQSKQIHMAVATATNGIAADPDASSSSGEGEGDDNSKHGCRPHQNAKRRNSTVSAATQRPKKGWFYSNFGIRSGTPNTEEPSPRTGKKRLVPSYERVSIPPQSMIIHELSVAEVRQFSMAGATTANVTLSTLTIKKNLPLYLASLYPGVSPAAIVYYNTESRNPFHSYHDVMMPVGVIAPAENATQTANSSRTSSTLNPPAAAAAAYLSPYYTSEEFTDIQRRRAESRRTKPDGGIGLPKYPDGSSNLINGVFMASPQMAGGVGGEGGGEGEGGQLCFSETTGIFIRIPIQDREHFLARVMWQSDVVRTRHERLLLQCINEKRGLHPEATQWVSKAVRIALGHTRAVVTCFSRAQKLFYDDSGFGGLLGGVGLSYYYHPETAREQKTRREQIEAKLALAPSSIRRRYLKKKKAQRLRRGPYDLGGANFLCLDDAAGGLDGDDRGLGGQLTAESLDLWDDVGSALDDTDNEDDDISVQTGDTDDASDLSFLDDHWGSDADSEQRSRDSRKRRGKGIGKKRGTTSSQKATTTTTSTNKRVSLAVGDIGGGGGLDRNKPSKSTAANQSLTADKPLRKRSSLHSVQYVEAHQGRGLSKSNDDGLSAGGDDVSSAGATTAATSLGDGRRRVGVGAARQKSGGSSGLVSIVSPPSSASVPNRKPSSFAASTTSSRTTDNYNVGDGTSDEAAARNTAHLRKTQARAAMLGGLQAGNPYGGTTLLSVSPPGAAPSSGPFMSISTATTIGASSPPSPSRGGGGVGGGGLMRGNMLTASGPGISLGGGYLRPTGRLQGLLTVSSSAVPSFLAVGQTARIGSSHGGGNSVRPSDRSNSNTTNTNSNSAESKRHETNATTTTTGGDASHIPPKPLDPKTLQRTASSSHLLLFQSNSAITDKEFDTAHAQQTHTNVNANASTSISPNANANAAVSYLDYLKQSINNARNNEDGEENNETSFYGSDKEDNHNHQHHRDDADGGDGGDTNKKPSLRRTRSGRLRSFSSVHPPRGNSLLLQDPNTNNVAANLDHADLQLRGVKALAKPSSPSSRSSPNRSNKSNNIGGPSGGLGGSDGGGHTFAGVFGFPSSSPHSSNSGAKGVARGRAALGGIGGVDKEDTNSAANGAHKKGYRFLKPEAGSSIFMLGGLSTTPLAYTATRREQTNINMTNERNTTSSGGTAGVNSGTIDIPTALPRGGGGDQKLFSPSSPSSPFALQQRLLRGDDGGKGGGGGGGGEEDNVSVKKEKEGGLGVFSSKDGLASPTGAVASSTVPRRPLFGQPNMKPATTLLGPSAFDVLNAAAVSPSPPSTSSLPVPTNKIKPQQHQLHEDRRQRRRGRSTTTGAEGDTADNTNNGRGHELASSGRLMPMSLLPSTSPSAAAFFVPPIVGVSVSVMKNKSTVDSQMNLNPSPTHLHLSEATSSSSATTYGRGREEDELTMTKAVVRKRRVSYAMDGATAAYRGGDEDGEEHSENDDRDEDAVINSGFGSLPPSTVLRTPRERGLSTGTVGVTAASLSISGGGGGERRRSPTAKSPREREESKGGEGSAWMPPTQPSDLPILLRTHAARERSDPALSKPPSSSAAARPKVAIASVTNVTNLRVARPSLFVAPSASATSTVAATPPPVSDRDELEGSTLRRRPLFAPLLRSAGTTLGRIPTPPAAAPVADYHHPPQHVPSTPPESPPLQQGRGEVRADISTQIIVSNASSSSPLKFKNSSPQTIQLSSVSSLSTTSSSFIPPVTSAEKLRGEKAAETASSASTAVVITTKRGGLELSDSIGRRGGKGRDWAEDVVRSGGEGRGDDQEPIGFSAVKKEAIGSSHSLTPTSNANNEKKESEDTLQLNPTSTVLGDGGKSTSSSSLAVNKASSSSSTLSKREVSTVGGVNGGEEPTRFASKMMASGLHTNNNRQSSPTKGQHPESRNTYSSSFKSGVKKSEKSKGGEPLTPSSPALGSTIRVSSTPEGGIVRRGVTESLSSLPSVVLGTLPSTAGIAPLTSSPSQEEAEGKEKKKTVLVGGKAPKEDSQANSDGINIFGKGSGGDGEEDSGSVKNGRGEATALPPIVMSNSPRRAGTSPRVPPTASVPLSLPPSNSSSSGKAASHFPLSVSPPPIHVSSARGGGGLPNQTSPYPHPPHVSVSPTPPQGFAFSKSVPRPLQHEHQQQSSLESATARGSLPSSQQASSVGSGVVGGVAARVSSSPSTFNNATGGSGTHNNHQGLGLGAPSTPQAHRRLSSLANHPTSSSSSSSASAPSSVIPPSLAFHRDKR